MEPEGLYKRARIVEFFRLCAESMVAMVYGRRVLVPG